MRVVGAQRGRPFRPGRTGAPRWPRTGTTTSVGARAVPPVQVGSAGSWEWGDRVTAAPGSGRQRSPRAVRQRLVPQAIKSFVDKGLMEGPATDVWDEKADAGLAAWVKGGCT